MAICANAAKGFWKQGRGATRLVQIIGRSRGKRVSLQLIVDEPPLCVE